ncbi:uncharacterized protein LOC126377988 [Pectinophora gossypiella]|uniref:uncharacterized protein LOC126377988 n=1 Tax=Pectinophora gossypiella TaxID=13191 RepID=UPI00214EBA8D|nr:uncharacterized protein LOC126377988 [Pectinophora gossypiella]
MPESYEFLTKQLNATVLNKYNILGDGMPAALFPILSGKTEFELPDAKKRVPGSGFMDETQFIFHRVKKIGYQAAYFEDLLRVYSGTYQYRFNGFRRQPADHYLSHLLREDQSNEFCFGGAPRFQFMMNLTEQFFELPGKHFIFTLISDITHNDINYLHNADKPLVEVLERLEKQGTFQNTLLIVMGDHGSRIKRFRYTYQAKLEERLPFMAIRLPDKLKAAKPIAQKALQGNVDVLTTAHDIHATILDIVGLKKYLNPYKVKGADLPRAMSLIRKVPRNRSCSEAGIEPHWCTCLRWEELAPADSMYERAARAVVNHINHITKSMRYKDDAKCINDIHSHLKQYCYCNS